LHFKSILKFKGAQEAEEKLAQLNKEREEAEQKRIEVNYSNSLLLFLRSFSNGSLCSLIVNRRLLL
jgi:hypothetical protein